MKGDIVIDEDGDAWIDVGTDCEKCDGPCRIKPTWHACRINGMLLIGEWGHDETEWRFPVISVLHIELHTDLGLMPLGRMVGKPRVDVILHTHYGVHTVHTCVDMEHATTLRDELLTLIGWKDVE